jgi:hypothetical protein
MTLVALQRNIEALIEQEYLRRHENSRDVYDYIGEPARRMRVGACARPLMALLGDDAPTA